MGDRKFDISGTAWEFLTMRPRSVVRSSTRRSNKTALFPESVGDRKRSHISGIWLFQKRDGSLHSFHDLWCFSLDTVTCTQCV